MMIGRQPNQIRSVLDRLIIMFVLVSKKYDTNIITTINRFFLLAPIEDDPMCNNNHPADEINSRKIPLPLSYFYSGAIKL